MNVSLTPEIESWIQEKVQSGFYQSASEVVRDALRLLHDYEALRADSLNTLKADLLIGLNDLEKGNAQILTPQLVADIKSRARQRLAEN